MKKLNFEDKINDLPSLKDIVEKEKKDLEFNALLNKARLRVAIARQIKIIREEAGLTQAELSEALGISQSMIGRLEGLKDKRLPSIELLVKIVAITKKKLIVDQSGLHLEFAAK